jgi:hypothetical protein
MNIDLRWIVYFAWGVASMTVWGMVVSDAWGRWQERRDRRAKRELLRDAGLFFTASGASLSIASVLLGETGSPARTFALALALGMFLGAGIVSLGERRNEN